MTAKTSYKIGLMSTIIVMLLGTSIVSQQDNSIIAQKNGLDQVPSNAVGFAHLHVARLSSTPGMALPLEIFSGVKQEANELFEQHLGVHISELQTVTFVAPTADTFATLEAGGDSDCFGLFSFSATVNENFTKGKLYKQLQPIKVGKYTIYKDKGTQYVLFRCSENTIAIGSESGIRWFMKYRKNQSEGGLRSAMALADTGHLTIGINGDKIPAQMKMFFPPEMESFKNAEWAALNLNFDNGIAADMRVSFVSEQDASRAFEFSKQNIANARMMIQQEETKAQVDLKASSDDLLVSMGHLTRLAIVRFSDKILQRMELNQANTEVHARVAVEGFDGQMLVITGLTAIQAIGTSAEAQFKDISSDLDDASMSSEFDAIAKELENARKNNGE